MTSYILTTWYDEWMGGTPSWPCIYVGHARPHVMVGPRVPHVVAWLHPPRAMLKRYLAQAAKAAERLA